MTDIKALKGQTKEIFKNVFERDGFEDVTVHISTVRRFLTCGWERTTGAKKHISVTVSDSLIYEPTEVIRDMANVVKSAVNHDPIVYTERMKQRFLSDEFRKDHLSTYLTRLRRKHLQDTSGTERLNRLFSELNLSTDVKVTITTADIKYEPVTVPTLALIVVGEDAADNLPDLTLKAQLKKAFERLVEGREHIRNH
jgi:hypothetical protein